jgi:hypothetical protein
LRSLEATTNSIQQQQQQVENSAASLLIIRGESVTETPQFKDKEGTIDDEITPIAKGASLVLAYPMVKKDNAVLMRCMVVDPHIATVSWTWVKLYEEGSDQNVLFVSNFSCM